MDKAAIPECETNKEAISREHDLPPKQGLKDEQQKVKEVSDIDPQNGVEGCKKNELYLKAYASEVEENADGTETEEGSGQEGEEKNKENRLIRMCGVLKLGRAGAYPIYVLLLLLLAYLLNQLDRYMLAIVTKPMAQAIHYGDKACMMNTSHSAELHKDVTCSATSEEKCVSIVSNKSATERVCEWNYNGQGFEYQILAGPIFIVIYTFAGIFLGLAADLYNRRTLLAICLVFWSLMTLLTGAVNEYWQLVILRFGLGIGEAGCTPFAASLIGDYFDTGLRATALGVYNWGIYLGYSLSYALGNFITKANILGQGWRWSFYISGMPGILLGVLILCSVKEPQRKDTQKEDKDNEVEATETDSLLQSEQTSSTQKVKKVARHFLNPSLLLLCLAGSIRNAAGYVWAYNTQVYFESIGQTSEEIGSYMSWIPIVGGLIGTVLGGFISDRVVLKHGPNARILVCIVSLILAAPFAAGALFLNPPYAYLSLIPCYVIGEMWIGVTMAVVIELVPASLRTTSIAFYLFIITNIGGNIPLLVPPIQKAFHGMGYSYAEALRAALYILYPGQYLLGALLFGLTLTVLRRDLRRAETNYETIDGENRATT